MCKLFFFGKKCQLLPGTTLCGPIRGLFPVFLLSNALGSPRSFSFTALFVSSCNSFTRSLETNKKIQQSIPGICTDDALQEVMGLKNQTVHEFKSHFTSIRFF